MGENKKLKKLKDDLFLKTYFSQCQIRGLNDSPIAHEYEEIYKTFYRALYSFSIDIICDCGLEKEFNEWIRTNKNNGQIKETKIKNF